MPYKDPEQAREHARLRSRVYRARHPRRVKASQKKSQTGRYQKWLLWFNEQKDRPCMDCGVKYPPCVMDFDHVRGLKVSCLGWMWDAARDKVISEIAKCDLVCSNCHRLRTAVRRALANGSIKI
jgi:hypothetical protein